MPDNQKTQVPPQLVVYTGPSLAAPFPALVVELESPPAAPSAADVARALAVLLPPDWLTRVNLALPDGRFATLVVALANAIGPACGADPQPLVVEDLAGGRSRCAAGYVEPAATAALLETAVSGAVAILAMANGRRVDTAAFRQQFERSVAELRRRQPDAYTGALLQVARRRGMPVAPVASGSRVWLYGQGSRGVHLFEAASHRDGMTGRRLAHNKLYANQLVVRLGLPGVRHGIARNLSQAKALAREIGYPVVVKPIAGSKGKGVTVHITDDAELEVAFAQALRSDQGDVLVERHVVGEDHRLVVIGGAFAWAVRRSPPAVTGDGQHSIRELVDAENRRRKARPDAALGSALLQLDADAIAILARQGLDPGARPGAGVQVRLGHVANMARGGSLADCTAQVHPEVRDMAVAIARSFHLDAIGIDFMTPDVSRSWREVECAVLEVNSTPGFSSEARAEMVLEARFPGGGDGRIPSFLLVGAATAAYPAVVDLLAGQGLRVGVVEGGNATVAGQSRRIAAATLSARVEALVFDAGCDALVVASTVAELERDGLPIEQFSAALVPAEFDGTLRQLITSGATRVCELGANGELDAATRALLESIVAA